MDKDIKEHFDWVASKYQIMLAAYLNKTALIEDKIDELLAISFLCQTNIKWQYINIILADISLGQKVGKLQKTLKLVKPDIFTLYEKEDLTSRLDKIRKRRNLFAHSVLNSNYNYLSKKKKDEICLLSPRDKQPFTAIKLKDFDNWNKDAKKVLEILTNYIQIIETNNN